MAQHSALAILACAGCALAFTVPAGGDATQCQAYEVEARSKAGADFTGSYQYDWRSDCDGRPLFTRPASGGFPKLHLYWYEHRHGGTESHWAIGSEPCESLKADGLLLSVGSNQKTPDLVKPPVWTLANGGGKARFDISCVPKPTTAPPAAAKASSAASSTFIVQASSANPPCATFQVLAASASLSGAYASDPFEMCDDVDVWVRPKTAEHPKLYLYFMLLSPSAQLLGAPGAKSAWVIGPSPCGELSTAAAVVGELSTTAAVADGGVSTPDQASPFDWRDAGGASEQVHVVCAPHTPKEEHSPVFHSSGAEKQAGDAAEVFVTGGAPSCNDWKVLSPSDDFTGLFKYDWRDLCDDKPVWTRPAYGRHPNRHPRVYLYWLEGTLPAWYIGTTPCEMTKAGGVLLQAPSRAKSPGEVQGDWSSLRSSADLENAAKLRLDIVCTGRAASSGGSSSSHSMRTSEAHLRKPDGQRPHGADTSNFVVPGVCVISMLLGACCMQLNAAGNKRAIGIRKKHRSVMQSPGSDEESDLLDRGSA